MARGLGDHDLIVKSSLVNCKEFLSCQPEVRVKSIDELHKGVIDLNFSFFERERSSSLQVAVWEDVFYMDFDS